jgi:riboflavin kinase/FMN adenylyltransferase
MKVVMDQGGAQELPFEDSVVTIGVFDGVHTGHQNVLRRLAAVKRETGSSLSVLLTFDRHPLSVTKPERAPKLLTTLDEKLSILGDLDMDVVLVERFTAETACLDYRTFLSDRLVGRLGMKHLVVGYDFHLGRDREGSQEQIVAEGRRGGFGVTIVPPVVLCGSVVSSTKIRRAIRERKLGRAARLLTRDYFFDAEVVRGAGLGSGLRFPTANVEVADRAKLLPPSGVYAVRAGSGGMLLDGMMNIGSAPTLHQEGGTRIEVHLFDFEDDLYGKSLRIHCVEYIREEKRFEGAAELQAQLERDREKAAGILEKKH